MIEQAIAYFEDLTCRYDELIDELQGTMQAELTEQKQHFEVALECMRRATQPNEPLSLAELQEMDGELVRVPETGSYFGGVGKVNVSKERVDATDDGYWDFNDYETCWLAYRTKPEVAE